MALLAGGHWCGRQASFPKEKLYSRDDFLRVFDSLRDELIGTIIPSYEMPEEAVEWTRRSIEFTVPGGKLNRGLTVVHTVQLIRHSEGAEASAEELRRAAILGWCVEWLQAFFLVADDVMDSSISRRGKPCWYRLPGVGLIAVNDAFLLKSHIFLFLKRHFGTDPFYAQLMDLFIETTWRTELGQMLDLTSQPNAAPIAGQVSLEEAREAGVEDSVPRLGGAIAGSPEGSRVDLTRFTHERYINIVEYKTAFYSFYLPVALGLVLTGHVDEETLERSKVILVEMGEYFQIQDDYLDCFGSPETIGKIGTDIEDNKCSWLVVQALERASPEQKETLIRDYGKHDPAAVQRVKDLYAELDLAAVYHAYERETCDRLTRRIHEVAAGGSVPASIYQSLLSKISNRSS